MSQLSDAEKTTIICLHKKGSNIQDISELLKINRNTVSKWIYRDKKLGNTYRKIGSGRREEMNNDTIVKIMDIVSINTYITLDELHDKLKELNISVYMIRKILHKNGYKYGIPQSIFPLTEEHKKKRLEFAIKYQNFDFTKVNFADEVSFWKNNVSIQRWHNPENIYDRDIMFKHSAKLNAWGCISHNKVSLYIFSENMDADKYIEILQNNYISKYDKNDYLICDNDPKHTSVKVKTFLSKHKVKILDFPPYSPDINGIENVWALTKHNLAKKEYSTMEEFKECISNAFSEIKLEDIQNIVKSINNRLKRIIDAKGSYIS